MPVEISTFHLPCGARCVRMDCVGDVDKADADQIMKQVDLGGPLHGLPTLGLTQRMRSLSADARGVFGRRSDGGAKESWRAVVVTSPLARVASNFLMRVYRLKKHRLFAKEADAVSWLDERVREEAGGGTAAP